MKRNGLKRSIIAAVLFALLSGCGAKREPDTADSASPAPAMTAAPAAEGFSVDILSTGKSDCAIIYMDGLVLLSDTADEDDYDQIASKLIADGVSRIDYIILSHYDSDHIGSAAKLIRNFEVGAVLRPDYVEESGEYYALIKAESAANTQTVILGENYYIRTANGVVTVDPPDKDYGDDNNNSAVTLISYRGKNLLFSATPEKRGWRNSC